MVEFLVRIIIITVDKKTKTYHVIDILFIYSTFSNTSGTCKIRNQSCHFQEHSV